MSAREPSEAPRPTVGQVVRDLGSWLAEAAGGLLIGLTIVIAILTFEPLWVALGLVLLVAAVAAVVLLFTRWRTRRQRWLAFGVVALLAALLLAAMGAAGALALG